MRFVAECVVVIVAFLAGCAFGSSETAKQFCDKCKAHCLDNEHDAHQQAQQQQGEEA